MPALRAQTPAARRRRPARVTPDVPASAVAPSQSRPAASRSKSAGGLSAAVSALCVFLPLAALRVSTALVAPIADCDETFNYWEPLHYLLYGFGLQTWEYSPAFALRSYAFLFPYYAIARAASRLLDALDVTPPVPRKIVAFYAVRAVNALASAAAETALVRAAGRQFGAFAASSLALFLLGSAGQARAAPELLPSSFAMVALTLAFAAWMRGRRTLAIFLVALASLLGWVFAAVLGVPLALHSLLSSRGSAARFARDAALSGAAIAAAMVPVDTHYFGTHAFAPLAHVLYNVFPRKGTGSHLFGVDDWTFYPRNLALNLNVQAILFALYPLQLLAQCALCRAWRSDVAAVCRRCRFLAAPYLALAVFVAQPHKEERFLAPMYPLVSLVASVALADGLHTLCHLFHALFARYGAPVAPVPERAAMRAAPRNALPAPARLLGGLFALAGLALGASRIAMQVRGYGAPLHAYARLAVALEPRAADVPEGALNVCVGKEWYRFGGSFFLPENARLRFVRAGFKGLLPKPFDEGVLGSRVAQPGLNEFNREDPDQYYDWRNGVGCHFFVDLDLSHRATRDAAPDSSVPIAPGARRVLFSEPFLDAEASPPGIRALFIPGTEGRLVWGKYVVLQNTELVPQKLDVGR